MRIFWLSMHMSLSLLEQTLTHHRSTNIHPLIPIHRLQSPNHCLSSPSHDSFSFGSRISLLTTSNRFRPAILHLLFRVGICAPISILIFFPLTSSLYGLFKVRWRGFRLIYLFAIFGCRYFDLRRLRWTSLSLREIPSASDHFVEGGKVYTMRRNALY